ncbi:pseudaminic acid cytidylyltransferase [Parvibaculum sp.]|uniref:pseudaminic acid cytidylyltransferase n=1 Tax=Parvibaculum sp. TaxID=2024848 RepID=UPI00349FF31A
MIIAVIPARGGSKRIPGKNIRPFAGKPIIAWSIEAARDSGLFDRVIVSTDDEKIAEVAREWGAEAPFVRPAALSDDMTGTMPVVLHAAEWMAEHDRPADYVCCIYATAPFVTSEALRRGFETIKKSGAAFALAVTSFSFPVQRAFSITPQGQLAPMDAEAIEKRSQDLEEAWHDAGQFFWALPPALADGLRGALRDAVPVRLPRHEVQDIDTEEDWQRAEAMFRAQRL